MKVVGKVDLDNQKEIKPHFDKNNPLLLRIRQQIK
jgi:hypothetical protein